MSTPVAIELLSLVFSLPQLVAQEEGYFADEGLDVSFVSKESAAVTYLENHELLSAFGATKSHFESGEAALYRACEWGQIRRSYDSTIGGRIVSKRAAVAGQGIVVRPDSPDVHLSDLANKEVAVNFHHGSHYVALQMLEGFVPRDEIKVVHLGGPQQRLTALRDNEIPAAALMEPWLTLAEKQGYHVLAEAFYTGSEVAGAAVDVDTYDAIGRAVNRAVVKLNENPRRYLHHLIAEVPPEFGELSPQDFPLRRFRFVPQEPYPEEQFQRTYEWMLGWGLMQDDSGYHNLVHNLITT